MTAPAREVVVTDALDVNNVSPLGGGEGEFHALSLGACASQFLIGTQQVAWLQFTAVSNQTSAFVPLLLDNTVGRQPDGAEVRNFAPQSGRVVVVGEEPLLEALRSTNGQVQLLLYAPVGSTNVLQSAAFLPAQSAWTPFQQVTPTNLLTNPAAPARHEPHPFHPRGAPVALECGGWTPLWFRAGLSASRGAGRAGLGAGAGVLAFDGDRSPARKR